MEEQEEWEIKYRKRLDEILPNGAYDISTNDITCYTGKYGYIDFLVALKKEAMKYSVDEVLVKQLKEGIPSIDHKYNEFNEKQIRQYLEDIIKR